MTAEVDLAVDALAVARLTRLVVADTITTGPRDAVIRWAYARAGRAGELGDREEWASPAEVVNLDRHPPKLARLITCPWCAGVWVGAGVVVVRAVAPRAWRPVARMLAVSEAAGLLAGWEG